MRILVKKSAKIIMFFRDSRGNLKFLFISDFDEGFYLSNAGVLEVYINYLSIKY